MDALTGRHFDAVVIGCGMSGLAAGIRLALYDKSVLILDRHNAPGGLNSFYSRNGRKFDVGLHALTNYAPTNKKATPLGRIFRQLRIDPAAFALSPQQQSRIIFPGRQLRFTNNIAVLQQDVADQFPHQADAFLQLTQAVASQDLKTLPTAGTTARQFLAQYLSDQQLLDMILCPLMLYGSATAHDMPLAQFIILFQAIYLEGFARPYAGVRQIIRALLDKYRSLGGQRKMKCGVRQLVTAKDRVQAIILDSGVTITADRILSSAGIVETFRLCQPPLSLRVEPRAGEDNVGQISFAEIITVFAQQPQEFGWLDTICFFNTSTRWRYENPDGLVDLSTGVICFPNNYDYPAGQRLPEGLLRVTALANFTRWTELEEPAYQSHKAQIYQEAMPRVLALLNGASWPQVQPHILAQDMFTPRTIKKYTGHLGGAVYGAKHKVEDGRTPYKNLFLCGTDQGWLGITGAIMSGISMANAHVLAD